MPVANCGFEDHPLRHGVYVDRKYLSFILKTHPHFDLANQVCLVCRNSMEAMYHHKKQRARELRQSRIAEVSSVSSLSQPNSMDSFDSLVQKTPMHKKTGKDKSANSSVSIESRITKSQQMPILANIGSSSSSSSQSLNESTVNSARKKQQATSAVLQESRREMSTSLASSSAGQNSQPGAVEIEIQDVDNVVKISTPAIGRQHITRSSLRCNNVPSPTIYDDENEDVQYFRQTLRARLSQEPSTSAAAQACIRSLKRRRIDEYFGNVPKKATSTGTRKSSTTLTNSKRAENISNEPVVEGGTPKNATSARTKRSPRTLTNSNRTENISNEPVAEGRAQTNATTAGARRSTTTTESSANTILAIPPTTKSGRPHINADSKGDSSTNNVNDELVAEPRILQGDSGDDESSSDDDEPRMSLNFYNDNVRCPQYQPIPRRRNVIHSDPRIMDMYLQGITGG